MHDSEPDTFVIKTMPEKFSEILNEIGVSSTPKEIAVDDIEYDDASLDGVEIEYTTST